MQRHFGRIALRTSIIYAAIAGAWIFFSSEILLLLFDDPSVILRLEMYKGWGFVLATTVLLYASLSRQLRRWEEEAEKRKQAEELNQMLRHAIDIHDDGAYWMDTDNRFVYVNKAAATALGYTPEELLGKSLSEINPRATPERTAEVWRRLRAESFYTAETVHRRKDGSEFPVEIVSTHVRYGGKEFNCGFARDISERKRAEKALLTTLKEKLVLLKEIHHRVKNNLQVISSLLHLQAAQMADPIIRDLFRDSENRVRAMALVHERLYAAEDLAGINFQDYLASVTNELSRAYGKNGVTLNLQTEMILLSVDAAIPCGLIVNELVTNALKHAFPNGRTGTVTVAHRRVDDKTLELSVQDNGVGVSNAAGILRQKSMGMSVVTSLVDQISGTISLESGSGTKFTIRYPG